MGKLLWVSSPSFGDICTRKSASNLRMFPSPCMLSNGKDPGLSFALNLRKLCVVVLLEGGRSICTLMWERMDLAGHSSPSAFIKIFPSKPVICLLSTSRNLSWTILCCWVFNTLTPGGLWSSVLSSSVTRPHPVILVSRPLTSAASKPSFPMAQLPRQTSGVGNETTGTPTENCCLKSDKIFH